MMDHVICLFTFLIFSVHFLEGAQYSSQECGAQYYRYSSTHTACIDKKSTPNKGIDWKSISDADRELIVTSHNHFRGNVHLYNGGKRASNMLRISYDRELENLAQLWAGNCVFAHDAGNDRYIPGKYGTGQNVATGASNWATVLQLWHSEVKSFNYDSTPKGGRTVGHYTQMVWAESTRVGCGVQICNGSTPFYVCNYAPLGNDADRIYKPYNIGDLETDCPTYQNSSSGFCDCTQNLCYNGGVVDTRSCTCRCPTASWLQSEDCAMKCGSAEDSPICAKWGPSYCKQYTNVRAEYCPYMCNVCVDQNAIPPPTMPRNTTTGSPLSTVTAGAARGDLPYCSKQDPALCGQPNRKTGYLPATVCLNSNTALICPAMCRSCLARTCVDYDDNSYNIGETWINMYGRYTCTAHGVAFERGCQTQDRQDIVHVNTTTVMRHENGQYSCHCSAEDDDMQRLNCVPLTVPNPTDDGLDDCDRVEGARCGLPRTGSYWLKNHCKIKMVRRLCPAMCKICRASRCRTYQNSVVGIGTEYLSNGNNLYVCMASGWVIGPTINIQAENTTGAPIYQVIPPAVRVTQTDDSSSATTATSSHTTVETTTTTTTTPSTPTPTVSTTTSTPRPLHTTDTATTAPSPLSYFDFDGFDIDYIDPYVDDYLEAERADSIEADVGSGDYSDDEDEGTSFVNPPTVNSGNTLPTEQVTIAVSTPTTTKIPTTQTPQTKTSRRTTSATTTTASTTTASTTTASTTTASTTTASTVATTKEQTTTIASTTIPSTAPPSTTTTSIPDVVEEPQTTGSPVSSIRAPVVLLRTDTSLLSALYPNTSAPCQQPDQPYCNQPLPGNTTSTFRLSDCSLNPLVCPGLCGLCQVTQCQDYSRQLYSVGESWHSLFARMTCGKKGVISERGCYYELLRMFVESGQHIEVADGFLTHKCHCNVSIDSGVWSHDLQCARAVSTEQRITVAPKEGFCERPDDHRCTDPYYTYSDCTFIHVATLCGAMCGKCQVSQCKDSSGELHEVGESWITTIGKMVCTQQGLKTVRGCRFTQQDTFIEVNQSYIYTSAGVDYTCSCEKASAYRYQLTCEGQRKRVYNPAASAAATTTAPVPRHERTTVQVTTTPQIQNCKRMDNPKCGQKSEDYWSISMCTSRSKGWRSFMGRVCPALCGNCQAKQCRGYDGIAYKVGESWYIEDIEHTCTAYGIEFYE